MSLVDALWRRGFAKQAYSDHLTYLSLCKNKAIDECQRLHYLQMSLEKLAKSHLYFISRTPASIPPSIQSSHKFIAKVIPLMYRDYLLKNYPKRKKGLIPIKHKKVKLLCQEIDLLAPANDQGGTRKDNCEYPWEVTDQQSNVIEVVVPVHYDFPIAHHLRQPDGIGFLKVMFSIIEHYEKI